MPSAPKPKPTRSPLRWLRANRNLVLFGALILLIVLLPAFEISATGERLFTSTTMLIIVAAVVTNGRSRFVFWFALLLAGPALVLVALAHFTGRDGFLVWAWMFAVAVHVTTIFRLLGEVFSPGSITRDRLFGCASVYTLMGVLWCYLYALAEHFIPNSFSGMGGAKSTHVADLAYFSFNIVTQVGLTDVVPVSKAAQSLVILQELASVLYMAFVISRLVGLYAPAVPEERDGT